jgi:DNA polymerase III epsilon subunit family exonuclease
MHDLIRDSQFQNLEKEYKFLSRARGKTNDELEYIIVDIETTGLEPAQAEITEIGAIKAKGGDIKDIFSALIRPKKSIPPNITRLTGIDDEMVRDCPAAETVLPQFISFIGNHLLIAHNAEFDIPFIKHHVKQATGQEISNRLACTLKLSRYLLPNLANHKLHTVAAHFGLAAADRHRAMGDVETTFQIWLKFIDLLKQKGINSQHELDALIARL